MGSFHPATLRAAGLVLGHRAVSFKYQRRLEHLRVQPHHTPRWPHKSGPAARRTQPCPIPDGEPIVVTEGVVVVKARPQGRPRSGMALTTTTPRHKSATIGERKGKDISNR